MTLMIASKMIVVNITTIYIYKLRIADSQSIICVSFFFHILGEPIVIAALLLEKPAED